MPPTPSRTPRRLANEVHDAHPRRSTRGAQPVLDSAAPSVAPSSGFTSGDAINRVLLKRDMPQTYTPAEVLSLQRTIGNQAVQRMLQPQNSQVQGSQIQGIQAQNAPPKPSGSNLTVQTKLTVGPAQDRYEQEADTVANQVMRSSAPVASPKASPPVAKGIQRMSGAAGGKVDSSTESAIQSARSGGQKLDDGLRSRMEGSFGANFSGVRVHADQQADSLNRSLNARAFTTGNDIFFKQGEYKPQSGGGQKLLAHELTHVVQQNGSGNLQRKSNVIQRAVGFEFEVGSWTLHKLSSPLTDEEQDGTDEVPAAKLAVDGEALGKTSMIFDGDNYAMMADTSDDAHVEFVTNPPFQETKDGRKTLVKTMKDMNTFCKLLLSERSNAHIRLEGHPGAKMLASDLPVHHTRLPEPNVLITPRDTINGEPQMTAGIRLGQLANVMEKMTSGALGGEKDKVAEQRNIGMLYLSGKKMRDAKLLSGGVGEAATAIQHFIDNVTFTGKDGEGNNIPVHMPSPSAQLYSLVALLRSYIVSAAGNIAYAKSLAPLMARTHFGEIFEHLGGDEVDFWRDYPNAFVSLVMRACGMHGQEDQPLFSGTSEYVTPTDYGKLAAGLTRKQWLVAMTEGRDMLTEAEFPDGDVDNLLFGLGGLGTKTDTVGKKRTFGQSTLTSAPVFEFRRMQGGKNFMLWPTLAEELFDYIQGINNRKNPIFSGKKTETLDKKLMKKNK